MLKKVFDYFATMKVTVLDYKCTPLKVNVFHFKCYLHKVALLKCFKVSKALIKKKLLQYNIAYITGLLLIIAM